MAKIKSIKFIGQEDVYNMEVKDYHNYSVNGGLIIHNCESIRYGIMSRPNLTEVPKEVDPYETTPEQRYNNMVQDMTGGSMPKGW